MQSAGRGQRQRPVLGRKAPCRRACSCAGHFLPSTGRWCCTLPAGLLARRPTRVKLGVAYRCLPLRACRCYEAGRCPACRVDRARTPLLTVTVKQEGALLAGLPVRASQWRSPTSRATSSRPRRFGVCGQGLGMGYRQGPRGRVL